MKIYVIHHERFPEIHGEVCGIPLLYVERNTWPQPKERIRSEETFFLDGTPAHNTLLGPCKHCGKPFEIIMESLMTEETFKFIRDTFKRWPEGFEKIHHCTGGENYGDN
jgi:hypothetical protein